jgi:hypothetical protein
LTEPIDRAKARKTTLTVAVVSLAAGAWQVYRARPLAAEVLIGVGGLLAIAGALMPSVAAWFHRGWMRLAEGLGYVNTRIILAVVFYGVLTPMRFALRVAGHDPLARRATRQPSYWVRRPKESRQTFERAF